MLEGDSTEDYGPGARTERSTEKETEADDGPAPVWMFHLTKVAPQWTVRVLFNNYVRTTECPRGERQK